MQRSQIPTAKLELAKSNANRTWALGRIVNSWLPAIQAGPIDAPLLGRLRRSALSTEDEPFDYRDLLKEVSHAEAEVQHASPPPNSVHAILPSSNRTADQGKSEECAGCIRLSKAQQETANSLQVARNVIESLQNSVSLLQARLELYEGGEKVAGGVGSRSDEENLRPTVPEITMDNPSCSSAANLDPRKKSNLAEPAAPLRMKWAVSSDLEVTEKGRIAFDRECSQVRKDAAQTLIAFGGDIRALAVVIMAQSKQIEHLKSSNLELSTRNRRLERDLQTVELEKCCAQEEVLFQAKAIRFLAKELQAERSTSRNDAVRLLHALRYERAKPPMAEREIVSIENDLAPVSIQVGMGVQLDRPKTVPLGPGKPGTPDK